MLNFSGQGLVSVNLWRRISDTKASLRKPSGSDRTRGLRQGEAEIEQPSAD
jgi:hypothetical protein